MDRKPDPVRRTGADGRGVLAIRTRARGAAAASLVSRLRDRGVHSRMSGGVGAHRDEDRGAVDAVARIERSEIRGQARRENPGFRCAPSRATALRLAIAVAANPAVSSSARAHAGLGETMIDHRTAPYAALVLRLSLSFFFFAHLYRKFAFFGFDS